MLTPWKGEGDDGVQFTDTSIEEVEITLLGRPEAIEQVVVKNLEFCKAAATGGDTAGWDAWFRGLDDALTEGECLAPLLDTIFDYLDIQTGWQRSFPICQGTAIRVSGDPRRRLGHLAQPLNRQPAGEHTGGSCSQERDPFLLQKNMSRTANRVKKTSQILWNQE